MGIWTLFWEAFTRRHFGAPQALYERWKRKVRPCSFLRNQLTEKKATGHK